MTLDFRVLTEQVSQNAVSRDLGVAVHFPTCRLYVKVKVAVVLNRKR